MNTKIPLLIAGGMSVFTGKALPIVHSFLPNYNKIAIYRRANFESAKAIGGVVMANTKGKLQLTSTSVVSANEAETFSPGTNYDYSESAMYNTIRITAKSTDDVALKSVTWNVAWSDKTVGGKVSDYVTVTPVTSDGLTVQVSVSQAIKSKVTVTATNTENKSVSGSIEIEYVKRVFTLNVGVPSISFAQENDYTLSFGSILGAGTLTPTVSTSYYAIFSEDFSETPDVYYEIDKQMTGAEWKTFLTSHAKDDDAMTALTTSNNSLVGIVCTATVTYNGKVYQFVTSDPVYPSFTEDSALIGSITEGENTYSIDGTSISVDGSDSAVSYFETESDSVDVAISGGNGDVTVTVDENLQDNVSAEYNAETSTVNITNTSDGVVSGEVTITSGNQTITIPIAFIQELTASVTTLELSNVNGGSSEITIEGGTGKYTVSLSESLEGSVSYSMDGNTLVLTYSYSSDVSGTVTVTSGSQTVTISVKLTYPDVTCLTGDTLITLADGSTKRIDEITYADEVLAIDSESGKLCATKITYTDADQHKVYNHYDKFEFDDGTVLKVVHRHRFYNCEDERMIHIDAFTLGDRAYKQDGTMPKLVYRKEHFEDVDTLHYTIFTEKQNYFANGLLSGNRFTKPITLNTLIGGTKND